TCNGGIHYGNALWGDSLKVNGNYHFAKNNVATLNNTVTKYILPDTQYLNNQHTENYNSRINHSVHFESEYQMDSMSELRIRANGEIGNNNSHSINNSNAEAVNADSINVNTQSQTNTGENKSLNAYLMYRRKFKKKGRSFSATLSESWNKSNSKGILQSEYHLFALDSNKVIDQLKLNHNQNQSLGLNLNYTEPLSKSLYLLFNYQLNVNDQESQIQSFNPQSGGSKEYKLLDSLYSSHYIYRIIGNRGGIKLQYNPKDKFRMTVGGDISSTHYTQDDRMADSSYQYNYLNFFPSVTIRYRKSMQSSFYFNYFGNSQQPTMSQLQPVRNNEDPLNEAIGNPDLKQAFHHDFRINY